MIPRRPRLLGRLLTLGFSLLLAAPAAAVEVDRIAAVVNDEVITLSELYDLGGDDIEQAVASGRAGARRELELEVLDALIMRRLVTQEIVRLNLDVTELELERALEDVSKRAGVKREDLRQAVESNGLPWNIYLNEMKDNQRQMKFSQAVLQPRISVNEEELLGAYKRAVAANKTPSARELGAIFFAVPAGASPEQVDAIMGRARAATARVNEGGEAFSAVSAELDEASFGKEGGLMGVFGVGEVHPAMEAALVGLPERRATDPVQTSAGIFVLTVLGLQATVMPSFDDMREDLMNELYSTRIEEEGQLWYRSQRRQAAIDIKLEVPGGLGSL